MSFLMTILIYGKRSSPTLYFISATSSSASTAKNENLSDDELLMIRQFQVKMNTDFKVVIKLLFNYA